MSRRARWVVTTTVIILVCVGVKAAQLRSVLEQYDADRAGAAAAGASTKSVAVQP